MTRHLRMQRHVTNDRGAATLELGMLLPVLLLIFAFIVPVVQAGWDYMTASRATAAAVRYASRVEENARLNDAGQLTRRPSAAEVEEFIRDSANHVELTEVRTFVGSQEGDPSGALPGEAITVTASYEASFGPLADLTNGLAQLVRSDGELLPQSRTVTVSARGRME